MAYELFADVYDLFNEDADYHALHQQILTRFQAHGIHDGIVVDLGCGTGDLTLLLAQNGYDMIGVDLSSEMLSILREKASETSRDILLLCQDLTQLDLYGTVRAAVSTFDTLNHIGPFPSFCKAIAKAALFIEPGGLFVFDMNTAYKHETILSDQVFELDADDVFCTWYNQYEKEKQRTKITIKLTANNHPAATEQFFEYAYSQTQIEQACQEAKLSILEICDGELFTPLTKTSQRYLITARKEP